MTRRRKIQIGNVTAVLVLPLTGTVISGWWTANRYHTDLEYSYHRSLSGLGDYVSSLETTFTKAAYANTPTQQNGVAARSVRDSSGAKTALLALPLKGGESDNMSKFLAQVEDFPTSLSTEISTGQKISTDEYEQIQDPGGYTTRLCQGLSQVEDELSTGGLKIGGTESLIRNLKASQPVFSDKLEFVAKDFEDYPQLIYDGPFSDHISQQKPRLIEGKAEVPQGNAQVLMAKFLNVDQSELIRTMGNKGDLPTYNFLYDDICVSVTKAGGIPVRLMNPRDIDTNNLNYGAVPKKAKEFLGSRGCTGMKESYYFMHDDKCTINSVYVIQGTVYYLNLIKVSVAIDNNRTVEMDATNYVMNHTNRAVPKVALTMAEAQKNVSPYLTVEEGQLAIIPTPGYNEVTTYEFLYENKDKKEEQVLVYADANEGFERDILTLLFSDNGVLTQ